MKHIQLVTDYILCYEAHFREIMEQQLKLESAERLQTIRKQLNWKEKRIDELKRLFIKIFENSARGQLNDERFDILSQSYETPQKQLEAEVIALRRRKFSISFFSELNSFRDLQCNFCPTYSLTWR